MTSALDINRRPLQITLAVLLLAATIFEAVKHGVWVPAAVGMLGPDIALLSGLKDGRLNPRGVPFYNALHSYYGPVVLMVVAATGVVALGFFVAGLAWAAHIAIDRALGYGLRTRDGFQR
ncbi:uncharacterized protein DUF4260 [Solirubrobacter pauli]|uniref:Uncharacterized protein DUF4260 n=1 Tax=Solirubrobacter pauli TaxID=166793 RepID=A0A660L5T9_9ACTN|nr:DUF4260 family protein [Solirubrobacter pauli]RKQ90347.1 uncharacterized protein DUF4260 [Solirubrobacter pauli]